jgi:hypothetical protein
MTLQKTADHWPHEAANRHASHDSCYSKCGASKAACDQAFRQNNVQSCFDGLLAGKVNGYWAFVACLEAANDYADAVTYLGDDAFAKAQRNCPNACSQPDPDPDPIPPICQDPVTCGQ